MGFPDATTAHAMLSAISAATERSLNGMPPSEVYGGILRAFVDLTGSRRGFLAEAVVGPNGALELVVRAGEQPGNLTALLGPALGTGQADATASALTLPLMAYGRLVGVVGLGGRAGGYDDAMVEGLQPLTVAAASLVVRLRLDIEHRHAESALRRSDERHRLATQRAVLTWEHDLATGEIRVDPLFYAWTGREPGTPLLAGDWESWHAPIDRDVARRQVDGCRTGALPVYAYEATGRRHDGELLHLLIRGTFLRTPDGHAFMALGAAHDLTEQRRVEHARREHEGQLRAVMESSLDGILLCHENAEIRAASRSAQRLLGFTDAELVGRNLGTLLGEPIGGRGGAVGRLWDPTRVAPLRKRHKTQAMRKDGSWFAIECSVAEARLGPRPAFAVILRDLTGQPETRTPVQGSPILQKTRELPRVGLDRTCLGSVVVESDGTLSFVSDGCRGIEGLDVLARDALPDGAAVPARINGRPALIELELRPDPIEHGRRHVVLYEAPAAGPAPPSRIASLVGTSPPMRKLVASIEQVAADDWTVLIEGETGSGKDLVAHAIHAGSTRRNGPFVAVSCAGMSDSLLSSQLFGHTRGAFTGASSDQQGLIEAAAGGTLFLDEIGDISPDVQRALLRVLEDEEIRRLGESRPRKVDVRIVSATHRDLGQRVAEGKFREDLLYRIRVARVHVPPLRERIEDIPLLVASFLARQTVAFGKVVTGVSAETLERLMDYAWPGNVRELRSAIGHAVIRCRSGRIEPEDLPPELSDEAAPIIVEAPGDERQRIVEALRRAGGNRSRAARSLGIGRATLYRRLDDLGITAVDTDDPLLPRRN